MPKDDEKSLRFLALRALIVVVLVLLILSGLDRMGITSVAQASIPTPVEQSAE